MYGTIMSIIIVAVLLSQIIGWEMVITLLFFGSVIVGMKMITMMTPVPVTFIVLLAIFAIIALLFVARYMARMCAEKKHPCDADFHKVCAEMARMVC